LSPADVLQCLLHPNQGYCAGERRANDAAHNATRSGDPCATNRATTKMRVGGGAEQRFQG
jgi:hypothetical protein